MGEITRKVRMGIDVGGTYTKCVAIDNATHEIIGKNEVKTTHDAKEGVALGVVQSFMRCLEDFGISPAEVVFVAHSTTQATNAFIEGDVAKIGIIGVSGGGIEGFLAKRQVRIDDVILDSKVDRRINIYNEFILKKKLTKNAINQAIERLKNQGAQVIVASMAFGVDSPEGEKLIFECAESKGAFVTMASDITKLYGLTRRTRTAAINASILPKMMATANATESSVKEAGVTVPLMIMRGDGGVMEINEMRARPILTALSGPAASVMGSLMYLHVSNGIYFEVGGTTSNIGVIKNGRPGVDYANIGGHDTYVSSLDVRILGCAGGSMVRISDSDVVDVGPRSAHIAGCEYACFMDPSEIENPQVELISPKLGDPSDYVTLRLESGRAVTITNTDAANALGLIDEEFFAHGNAESARKAMQPVAKRLGISVEQLAEKILEKDFEKVDRCISFLTEKYALDRESMKIVGCGGGAAALVPYCAKKLGLAYSIPENAEVISSIGVALAMVRDVVERIIPSPSANEIRAIKQEAIDKAIESGASADTVEVHVEIDSQTSKVTAIATGSTEVKTSDLTKNVDETEAREIAAEDLRASAEDVRLLEKTKYFYVFGEASESEKANGAVRVVDSKGFVKIQRTNAMAVRTDFEHWKEGVDVLWDEMSVYQSEIISRPDYYICHGARVTDFSAANLEQLDMLIDLELSDDSPDTEIIVIAANIDQT